VLVLLPGNLAIILLKLTDKDPNEIVAVLVVRHVLAIDKDLVPDSAWNRELVKQTGSSIVPSFIATTLLVFLQVLSYISVETLPVISPLEGFEGLILTGVCEDHGLVGLCDQRRTEEGLAVSRELGDNDSAVVTT
jgi:hypothetical protein